MLPFLGPGKSRTEPNATDLHGANAGAGLAETSSSSNRLNRQNTESNLSSATRSHNMSKISFESDL